jgi:hypothetical protein
MDEIIFPGTLEQALRSSQILPGSRLLLRGGNYLVGNVICTLSNITIMSYPGEQAVIIPASGYRAMLFESVSDITISGLIIDGSNLTNESVKVTGTSSNIRVTNCEIKNGRHGVLMTGAVNGCEIDNCNIHHNGIGHLDHGIYVSSQHAGLVLTVRNNQISFNSSNGVHAYAGGDGAEYIIRNNFLDGNGEVGIGCYHGKSQVYNNVVRGSGLRGITCRYDLVVAHVYFNTIGNSGEENIELAAIDTTPEIVIQNNLCFGTGGLIENTSGKSVTETNNLFGDVVDNGGSDIRPTITGNGIAIDGITTDYGGNARANPPTIGAWE